jgi:cytochrome c oxidase cbb3-type subunit 3
MATVKADAHAQIPHWPEPMLPTKYAYAGCGSCHTPTNIASKETQKHGQNLFERYACLSCHRMDGRGGTLRPLDSGGMEGPDLSRIGSSSFDQNWYRQHLGKSTGKIWVAQPQIWKASFRAIPQEDLRDIESFLFSKTGIPKLVEAKTNFNSLGCLGCHKVNNVGGDDGPELTGIGKRDPMLIDYAGVTGPKTFDNWIQQFLKNPQRVSKNAQMPTFTLSQEQLDLLTLYLLSLRLSKTPQNFVPPDRARVAQLKQREFATDGVSLYHTFCSACHGESGLGRHYPGIGQFPSVSNPDFLSIASDRYLMESITRGRPGRRMPAWGQGSAGLKDSEMSAIVSYLRHIADTPPPPADTKPRRWVQDNLSDGPKLYQKFCQSCHGATGGGDSGPALSNAEFLRTATDTFLVESVRRGRRGTSMDGFALGSVRQPALAHSEILAIVSYIRSWEKQKP